MDATAWSRVLGALFASTYCAFLLVSPSERLVILAPLSSCPVGRFSSDACSARPTSDSPSAAKRPARCAAFVAFGEPCRTRSA